ncbi:MAG: permease [Desulfuromonadaceae bacterium]|nr:permease [Desulfuromonadaceae bacterium]
MVLSESWSLFLKSAPYVVFGLLVSGVLSTVMSGGFIARHLGHGPVSSVIKAALFGVPLPLCSCGVLPAALTLKQQGANRGAVAAFLIATPESGVDSIAVSYALLDPLLTVVRPVAALLTAVCAGVVENLLPQQEVPEPAALPATAKRRSFSEGMRYAFTSVWRGMAGWFFLGLLLAGMISVLVPESLMQRWLGGGLPSMLIMLVVGIPLYICASASTPIAAALIMQGVSPGAALVFLLAGPATNATSLTVLLNLLGRRATLIYLMVLALGAILSGLTVDALYTLFDIEVRARLGAGATMVPPLWQGLSAGLLLLLSLPLLVERWAGRKKGENQG